MKNYIKIVPLDEYNALLSTLFFFAEGRNISSPQSSKMFSRGRSGEVDSTLEQPVEDFCSKLLTFLSKYYFFFPQGTKIINFCDIFPMFCIKLFRWRRRMQFWNHPTFFVSQVEKSINYYLQSKKIKKKTWKYLIVSRNFAWKCFVGQVELSF